VGVSGEVGTDASSGADEALKNSTSKAEDSSTKASIKTRPSSAPHRGSTPRDDLRSAHAASFSPPSAGPPTHRNPQGGSSWDFALDTLEPTPIFPPSLGSIEQPLIFPDNFSPSFALPNVNHGSPQDATHSHTPISATALARLTLEEAKLVRHYTENGISSWLDIGNRDRYFEQAIPTICMRNPCILNAVLGLAARQLSVTDGYDSQAYETYVRRCLALYIPPVGEHEADDLLALTNLLRLFDGLDVQLSDFDPASPLATVEDVAWTRSAHWSTSELSQTLIRSGLRQDIHTSFNRQEAVMSLLDALIVDKTMTPANDWVWQDRMLVHLGEILRFCFGASDRSVPTWNQLTDYSSQWWNNRPASFTPVYYQDPDGDNVFPEIWLANECHGTLSIFSWRTSY
jgi:hypothetical protein